MTLTEEMELAHARLVLLEARQWLDYVNAPPRGFWGVVFGGSRLGVPPRQPSVEEVKAAEALLAERAGRVWPGLLE